MLCQHSNRIICKMNSLVKGKKHLSLFLSVIFIFLFGGICTSLNAQTFQEGVKYRIVCGKYNTGSIGIGAEHGKDYIVCYVKNDADLTEDCYWYIDHMGEAKWRFRNAKTNQALTFTSGKDYDTYVRLKLSSVDDKNEKQVWTKGTTEGYFNFYYMGDEKYYLRKSSDGSMVVADKYEDMYSRFAIVDEYGYEVLAPGAPEGGHIQPSTDVAACVDSLMLNGRQMIYDVEKQTFFSVLPASSETDLNFTFNAADGVTVQVYDGPVAISKIADIELRKSYNIEVRRGNIIIASTPVIFTSLPILNINHEGKIEAYMDYVWGDMALTSPDEPGTVAMSAKFKTRGASAMQYKKKSLNMKLRERPAVEGEEEIETDANLLGIRSGSSWILDAMAADRVDMRNRVCFDLWNDFSKLPYETDFDGRNGTKGRFVEVWIKGKYNGIYCLTDRINRKLLDLKKPTVDYETGSVTVKGVLYKGNKWGYTSFRKSSLDDYIEKFGDTRNTVNFCEWELSEPEDYPCDSAWLPLYNLYTDFEGNLATPEFYEKMNNKFFLQNVADIHLFILAMALGDNGNKNLFYSVQNMTKEGDKSKFVISPWDMDASLGGNYDGSFYNGEYENPVIQNMKISKEGNPFKALWENSEDYRMMLASRWARVRDNVLSPMAVASKMRKYAELFTESGAWEREYKKWNSDRWYDNQLVPDVKNEVEQIISWYRNQRIPTLNDYIESYIDAYIDDLKPELGDANDDGVVDIVDLSCIASYILGDNPAEFEFSGADYNHDQEINVSDISLIANKILYGF